LGYRHHIKPAKPKWWKQMAKYRRKREHGSGANSLEEGTAPPSPQVHPHSHAHHDLGMKAVLIHVLGDAFNNLGVIISAVIL
jgi:zinc transporter 1